MKYTSFTIYNTDKIDSLIKNNKQTQLYQYVYQLDDNTILTIVSVDNLNDLKQDLILDAKITIAETSVFHAFVSIHNDELILFYINQLGTITKYGVLNNYTLLSIKTL